MITKYRNVILITIDSLNFKQLFENETSIKNELTFFKSIMNNSIIFDSCIANGAGTPACFPSIITSTYPLMYGGYKIFKDRIPIAELLEKNNINTIGIPNNAYLSNFFGYDRGYKFFYDTAGDNVSKRKKLLYKLSKLVYNSHFLSNLSLALTMCLDINPSNMEADDIKQYIEDLIKKNQLNNPFFLHLHFMDVHVPYYSSKIDYTEENFDAISIRLMHLKMFMYPHIKNLITEKDIEKLKRLYHLKLFFLDNELKQLFNLLQDQKLIDDTLIIITADHGEAFFEHGGLLHPDDLYEELIHVPLILYSKKINGPIWIKNLVEHLDIPPTISQAFDITSPKQYIGKSLFDIVNNDIRKDFIISEIAHTYYNPSKIDLKVRKTSIRMKNYKFIWNEYDNSYEFYNLKDDPEEKINLLKRGEKEKQELIIKNFKEILEKHIMKEQIESFKLKNLRKI